MTGGVIAALLIPVLVMGGIGAANAITTNGAVSKSLHTEAPPTTDPGGEAPGTDDPITTPDRVSDQNLVPPPEDNIYYIQGGDTLTKLSAKFGMSVDYIADYNAVRDIDVVSEGAVLRVPFIFQPPTPSDLAMKPAADPKG